MRQILLVITEFDPTAFREHSLALERVLQAGGAPVTLVDYPGMDHFTAIEQLCNPDYDLVHRMLAVITK